MSLPSIPNPNNTKSVMLRDRQGGTDHNMPAVIGANNQVYVDQLTAGSVKQSAAETLLSSTALVNLNQDPETNLYTAPQTLEGVAIGGVAITKVIIRNASANLTTASISFGWNAATDNDWAANATYTALTGSTLFSKVDPKAGAKLGTPGGVFSVICNTKQGGAATATIDVFGYFV